MKTNRPAVSTPAFGLLAWLESTRVALPLKGVECRFQITGALARVELDQIFFQNAERALDCVYTFPLPAGAAVYRCELQVNDRLISAQVKPREIAQRIYRKAKAAGRRAALVESARENLFTLSLGNVQPGDVIVVRFAWFQVLDRSGDNLRLLIPTCPGVRYIPGVPLLRAASGRGTAADTAQVPDASRITPPRIDALHPDAAYFSLTGSLSCGDAELKSISSPTHSVRVSRGEESLALTLAGKDSLPDRDFVLIWREPRTRLLASRVWQWRDGGETYALVQLRAPEKVAIAREFGQDFYFLLDRSGSMEGAKWQRTIQALHSFLALLGPQDRVWITLFESTFLDFAEVPMTPAAILDDAGFLGLEALGVGGGTELLPAALHVLQEVERHSAERCVSVVLITDGQLGNEQEIERAFQRAPHVQVHTFGIDTAVNDAFLKKLAAQQGGGCWLRTPDDDIAGTVASLGDRLRRPVLTGLTVGDGWESARRAFPGLHASEVVTLAFRGNGEARLTLSGRRPDGGVEAVALGAAMQGSEAIRLVWAQERISTLLAEGAVKDAVALACRHNLICEGAAFVAWDEAEKVMVAEDEVVQPSLCVEKPLLTRRCYAPPLCLSALADAESSHLFDGGFDGYSARLREKRRAVAGSLSAWPTEPGTESRLGKRLVVWAKAGGDEAENRMNALDAAAELIGQIRDFCGTASTQPSAAASDNGSTLRARLEERVAQALAGPPEALLEWAERFRPLWGLLQKLHCDLAVGQLSAELSDRLLAWALEDPVHETERLNAISVEASLPHRKLISSGAVKRQWERFLEAAGKQSDVTGVEAIC